MFNLKSQSKTSSLLSLSLLCLAASPIYAATQIDLSKNPAILGTQRHIAAAPTNTSIAIIGSHTDKNQISHVRIQQTYANVPVWGTHAIVHLPAAVNHSLRQADLLTTVNSNPSVPKNGFFYGDLAADIGNAHPSLFDNDSAKQRAIAVLKQNVNSLHPDKAFYYSDEEAKVIVYVDDNKKAHTAFLVSVYATGRQLPKRPTAIIDAQDNTIYKQWDDIKHEEMSKLEPAQALGFGGNPVSGKIEYGKDKPALPILRDARSNLCYMKNDDVYLMRKDIVDDRRNPHEGTPITFDCQKQDTAQVGYQESEGGYLGQFNGGYSPVNDAMHQGMVIKKLYQDWYDVTVLTQRDQRTPLKLSLNLFYLPNNKPYQNAFWNSATQEMYFGLGGDDLYPLVTLDVAAHEVSHGFTDQHSSLAYMDQSGALNESFSDMASVAASYYDSNETTSDWLIGGEVLKGNLGHTKEEYSAIRFIDDPAKDQLSIDNAEKYPLLSKFCKSTSGTDPDMYQDCIVHLASGVYNKLFYKLATSPGWNPRSAFGVMVKANQDYWTQDETYQTAACGVQKAAHDLSNGNTADVDKTLDEAFKSIGISLSACVA